MFLSVFQFLIAFTEVRSQLAPKLLKVSRFCTNPFKLGSEQVSYVRTGVETSLPQIQELPNLAKRKAQALHLFDKVQPCNVIRGVDPKATRCAQWLRYQGAAFVEPDCIHAERGSLGRFPNLHVAG